MELIEDRGQGDPLVLVCALMCDGDLFRHQLEHLSRRRRVLVALSAGTSSLRNAASKLHDRLVFRGLRGYDLGGLSMGGSIAQELLALHPAAVRRLVLMDTRCEADSEEARRARRAMIEELRQGRMDRLVEEFLPRLLAPQSLADPAIAGRVRAMFRRLGAGRFITQLEQLLTRRDTSAALRAFEGRALCLCGAQDLLTPPASHRRMAGLLPRGRFLVLPGNCGHLSAIEAPEAVTAALAEFLDG